MTNQKFGFLLISLFLVIGLLIAIFGVSNILHILWNTPPMQPMIPEALYFADLRHIIGANESLAQGLDPLLENPGDPWERTLTYPRVWLHLSEAFHLQQSHANYLGFINILLFIAGLLLFTSKIKLSITTVAIILLAVFSPAVILGLERGNIDVLLFFLFSIALFYISKPIIFIFIALTTSVLKVFPIFLLAGLMKLPKWSFIKITLLCGIFFIAYVSLTIGDLKSIDTMMPQFVYLSHGINIIWMTAEKVFNTDIGMMFKVATYLYFLGIIALIVFYIMKLRSHAIDKTYIDSFRIGSALFIGTFILNNNIDYRLVFLIFTIPQLVIWLQTETNILIDRKSVV